MQISRYGYTNINSEYLIYPFTSPIKYNLNYTGTYSKYSIVDKFYVNSLIKPTKRLYYGGAEWVNTDPIGLTFSLSNIAYSFADEILFMTASSPNISISAPDSSFDRIDAIVVNEDGQIKIKKGYTASSISALKKPVLGEDEVLIQYALVKAGVYKIGTAEIVYENNSQWQTNSYQISGSISGSVNFNSTNNQYNSTSCISANTDYRTGVNFTKLTGTINRSEYTSLSMRVRFNGDIDKNRFLSAQIYGTSSNYVGTASSNNVNLMAYGLDTNIIGSWQHIVIPTIKFGNKVETIKGLKIRLIGGAASSNNSWDLDYILFQTGVDYDEYTDSSNTINNSNTSIGIPVGGSTGQVLAKIDGTDYNTQWVTQVSGGGGSSLTVEDYLTGATYGNINNIVFRGNTVVIPGGLTATGVTVTEDEPVTPGSIMVWIPAPNYVGYFTPSFTYGGSNRYIMRPTTNLYNPTGSAGDYGIGSWSISTLFNAGTIQSVKTTSAVHSAFSATYFSCFDLNTTLTFTLYDDAGNEIRTSGVVTVNGTTSVSSIPSGITLNITSFASDNDRYKAVVNGTIDVNTVFPRGGRFKWRIVHNNSGNGPGANNIGSPTSGIYSYTSEDMFYDIDLSDSSSSANISGTVLFDEKTPTLKYYSGVAFYSIGSVFGFTVSGINLLNDITIPTTKQIDITTTNMAITSTHDGYADGTKPSVGAAITGWTYSWNISGLTYSKDGSVNQTEQYIPDYSSQSDNTLNPSNTSNITSRLYDLGQAAISSGSSKYMLFDTDTTESVSYIDNPLDSENGRLSFSGLSNISGKGVHPLSGTISGSATFSSNISLVTANDELQYIFGRVIYPQHNFTNYFPLTNISASVDYSSIMGASKNFDIYTYDGLVNGTGATTTESLSYNYRWHVTSYSKTLLADVSFTSGVFTFWSNFEESDLHWAYPTVGSDYAGTGQLAVLVGIDSSGNNLAPDKFMFVTGQASTYGARVSPGTYNLNATSPSAVKKIQWSIGTLAVNVRKVWLFVGYKENSARARNLWMTNINLSV
jgi:hypothetical protein